MKNRAESYHFALIFLMGLAPLLWFEQGHMIKQIDFDLPLTLERFKATFFSMWDYKNGAGLPRSLHMPALMFFLPQVLFTFLGFSIELIQRIFFCFWFMMPGFAFYYLMRVLLPESNGASYAGRLIAVSFYMFNLYLEPIWIGFNMANLSAYVAVPFALGVLIKGLREQASVFITAFKVGIIFSLFPAMATNPSMTLIAAVPFVVLIFKYIFDSKWKGKALSYLFQLLFLSFTFIILFNVYWILPEVKKLFESNTALTASGVVGGSLSEDVFFATDWVNGISKHTSLTNVIKMQGDWPWFQGFRKYATLYWENPFLMTVAWFPFALSLFALWKSKHSYKWFFGGTLFVALILSMGTHPPFGFLFSFLMENVPLFWTIRSPWYKFTFLTCLSYGVLIGLGAQIIFKALPQKKNLLIKMVHCCLLVFFIGVSPSYAFPLVQGSLFRKPSPTQGYPNHFKIPEHVKEASEWLNQRTQGERILDLPSRGITYNEWGYEGFLPLVGYFLKSPVFCDNHPLHIPYQGAWGSSWIYMQKLSRNSFEKGLSPYVSNLMRLLRIKYILHEEDFKYPVLPFPTSVKEINSKLGTLVGVEPVQSFSDKWSLWEVQNPVPEVYPVSKVSLVNGTVDALVPLSIRMNEKYPAYSSLSNIDSKMYERFIQDNYIQEVISFEDTLIDWTIHSLDPIYLHRLSVKPSDAWIFSRKKQFNVKEAEEYLIISKKQVANRETALRLGVDFTPYPQRTEIFWNLNVFQKSIKDIKKTDIIPDKPHVIVLKSIAVFFGIQYQNISLRVIKKITNVLLDKDKQGIWNRAMLYIDGKSRFFKDPKVLEISNKHSSKKWDILGELFLDKGEHDLLAKSIVNRRSIWEFYVVPKKHFLDRYKQALELYTNKDIGQSYIFSSTSSWNSKSDLEKKTYVLTEEKELKVAEDIHNRTFGYTLFNKEYVCTASHQFKILVQNPTEKTVRGTIAFNMISLQKKPKTFDVLFNNQKIRQTIIDPMQEYTILLKNLDFKPGKNVLNLLVYFDSVPLGDVLGNGEPRHGKFGLNNIRVGHLDYQEEFFIPSERRFEVKLFPFLGKGQNKEAWSKVEHLSEITVDGQTYSLEKVKEGELGFYLKVAEPLLLKEGKHLLRFSKEMESEYFVLLESKGELSNSLEEFRFQRQKPTEIEVSLSSKESQILIFSEAFDLKWNAFLKDGKEVPHFKINGYANAYLIPPGEKQQINLEYMPQRYFRLGLLISLISLFSALIFLLAWRKLKK